MRRALTALLSLWFAVVLGDPGMLHSCAMHGAGHGAHAAPSAAMHDMAGMPEHATHTVPSGSHDQLPLSCTCVGHCCAATTAAPVTGGPVVVVADLAPAPSVPTALASQRAPATPDRLLPFANGPPAV